MNRKALLYATLAFVIAALPACGWFAGDPLSVPAEFSFLVENEPDYAGTVFGALLKPFEEAPGMMRKSQVDAPALDYLLGAFTEPADLTAAGQVSGTFIPPLDVPRINESFVYGEVGLIFFMAPPGCPMTATNANEAAFAPVLELVLWDGVKVDENGWPDIDGWVYLELGDYDEVTETSSWELHVPVVSRVPWSASTGGPCAPTGEVGLTVDIDLQVAAGWQFVRLFVTDTPDGEDGWETEVTLTTRTLEEVAALDTPIGYVEAFLNEVLAAPLDASVDPAAAYFAYFFR